MYSDDSRPDYEPCPAGCSGYIGDDDRCTHCNAPAACATCREPATTYRTLFKQPIRQCRECALSFDRTAIADDEPTARMDEDRLEALKLEARMS